MRDAHESVKTVIVNFPMLRDLHSIATDDLKVEIETALVDLAFLKEKFEDAKQLLLDGATLVKYWQERCKQGEKIADQLYSETALSNATLEMDYWDNVERRKLPI